MLMDNIRKCSSESRDYKKCLPQKAIGFATDESLQSFLTVNDELQRMVGRGYYRTRAVMGAIGIMYYEQAYYEQAGRRRPREIQSVLLPTGRKWRGRIWAYLRGHHKSPITAPTCVNKPENRSIDGKPVFKVIACPTPELTSQLIAAFSASSLKPH